MTRTIAIFWLCAALTAALGLYLLKHEVHGLERDLRQEQSAMLATQEAIHVLRAEWSYLNQPAHIAELARRHLGLVPLPSEQVIELADLAAHLVPLEDTPDPEVPGPAVDPTLASARTVR